MSDARAYSGWKLGWMPDRLEDLRAGRLCRPCHLQLHLTARCNLQCAHCINGGVIPRLKKDAQAELTTAWALETIRDFAQLGGRALEFTGGGEPTLHPDFVLIADYALRRSLDVALITNGVVRREVEDKVLARIGKFQWTRISLDAVDTETYRARKGGPPDAFKRAVAFARDAVVQADGDKSVVGLSYLVSEETTTAEIRRAVDLAHDIGASIRFAPIYRESLPTNIAASTQDQIAALAVQDYLVIDMLPQRFADMAARFDHPAGECGYLYTSTVVTADAKVYPCCFMTYAKGREIGDLSRETFGDWWDSARRHQILKAWDCSKACNGCACWNREKNALFKRLVREQPRHLYFV